MQQQGFQTVDLLHAFIKTEGRRIDLETRSSSDLDHIADLLNGRANVLAKTDRPEWHCKVAGNIRIISTILSQSI